jgi:hypothetical protein
MSPNSPGDVPPAGPPNGLLAAIAAGKLNTDPPVEEHVAVDPNDMHQASSVDPNYTEPLTPKEWRDRIFVADHIAIHPLAERLVQRIEALELALRPLANQSVQVANARMCLMANGKADDPAGGLWVSGVQSIHCSPCEGIFYDAADVYGRGRVEENMARAFERVRLSQEAKADQSVHIEGGGKLQ